MSNGQPSCDPKVLVKDLGSKDGRARVRTRENLVKIGHPAVKCLIGALKDKNQVVRWEAAKSLGQIADPDAIDALVTALRDRVFDVQWLAAEALIKIGKDAVKPILHSLIHFPKSEEVRIGAHHIFHDMVPTEYSEILKPVIASLEYETLSVAVPIEAQKALDAIG